MHPELWTPCVNALCVLHDCVPWGLSPYFDPPHSLAITPQAHTYTARPDLHERMGGAQRRGAVVDAATALSDNGVLQGATWAELDRAKYRCYVDALDPLVLTLMQDRIRALDPEAVQPLQVHPLTMSAALIFVIENFHLSNHTSTTCQKFALRLLLSLWRTWARTSSAEGRHSDILKQRGPSSRRDYAVSLLLRRVWATYRDLNLWRDQTDCRPVAPGCGLAYNVLQTAIDCCLNCGAPNGHCMVSCITCTGTPVQLVDVSLIGEPQASPCGPSDVLGLCIAPWLPCLVSSRGVGRGEQTVPSPLRGCKRSTCKRKAGLAALGGIQVTICFPDRTGDGPPALQRSYMVSWDCTAGEALGLYLQDMHDQQSLQHTQNCTTPKQLLRRFTMTCDGRGVTSEMVISGMTSCEVEGGWALELIAHPYDLPSADTERSPGGGLLERLFSRAKLAFHSDHGLVPSWMGGGAVKASPQLAAWLTPATISRAEIAFLDAAYESAPADTDDKTPVADEEGLVHLYTALKTVTGQGLPKCVFARLAIPPPQLPTTEAAQWYMNDELLDCWAELLNRRFGRRCAILKVAAWHKLVGFDEADALRVARVWTKDMAPFSTLQLVGIPVVKQRHCALVLLRRSVPQAPDNIVWHGRLLDSLQMFQLTAAQAARCALLLRDWQLDTAAAIRRRRPAVLVEWPDREPGAAAASAIRPQSDTPHQGSNQTDCGVHVMAHELAAAMGVPANFSQQDMPFLRRFIGLRLARGGGIGDDLERPADIDGGEGSTGGKPPPLIPTAHHHRCSPLLLTVTAHHRHSPPLLSPPPLTTTAPHRPHPYCAPPPTAHPYCSPSLLPTATHDHCSPPPLAITTHHHCSPLLLTTTAPHRRSPPLLTTLQA